MIWVDRPRLTQLALTALLVLLLTAAVACDPGEAAHIENRTDQTVVVFENGTEIHRLAPGDSGDYAVLEFEGTETFEVRTVDGVVLATRSFTWDEIHRENGIRLIVQ